MREPRRPGQTRDARGAEAVLLESRSSRLARPSHAATSGPPRLSDVRAHTPRAHGGPPGAPEVPPDLPSAPRPSPIGTPPYRGHRPRPLTHRRLQTPDTDTGHRPRARAAAEGAWGGRARPEPRRRRGPPPTPLSPAPYALPPRYRAPPPKHPPSLLGLPFLALPYPPTHLPGPARASEVDPSNATSTWAARSCRGRKGGQGRGARERHRLAGQTLRLRCWQAVSLSPGPPAPPHPRPTCRSD